MKLSLSTNWCNRRIDDGREIAEKALELGFEELELGFHTTAQQVAGFKAMLDKIPVGSVHAFCPVPLSAPHGYPELYQLATLDEEGRKMAVLQVTRNIDFAAEMGAATVVLHAGRVAFDRIFDRIDSGTLRDVLKENKGDVKSAPYVKLLARASKRRVKRGERLLEAFQPHLTDYEDIPFYSRYAGWQYKLHVFMNPLYYIDYALAQIVAFQFWMLSLEDENLAWKKQSSSFTDDPLPLFVFSRVNVKISLSPRL